MSAQSQAQRQRCCRSAATTCAIETIDATHALTWRRSSAHCADLLQVGVPRRRGDRWNDGTTATDPSPTSRHLAERHGLCCTSTRRRLGNDPARVPLDVDGVERRLVVINPHKYSAAFD
jgi:hypothetical protein